MVINTDRTGLKLMKMLKCVTICTTGQIVFELFANNLELQRQFVPSALKNAIGTRGLYCLPLPLLFPLWTRFIR